MTLDFLAKRLDFFWYLNQQAETLVRAAGLLKEASLAGVMDEEWARRIDRLESEGDALFHELTDKLNRTFVTPLDREDLHALGNALDDVVDLVNAMAGRVLLYRLDPSDAHFARLVGLVDLAAAALAAAVRELPDPARRARVLDRCLEVKELETRGDAERDRALSRLFDEEPNPMAVLKWKELYETAETALDRCERAARVIKSVLVKHS
ncbi:MAG: DUF47 domain-containing protein [Elusimicrobiales bacterium]